MLQSNRYFKLITTTHRPINTPRVSSPFQPGTVAAPDTRRRRICRSSSPSQPGSPAQTEAATRIKDDMVSLLVIYLPVIEIVRGCSTEVCDLLVERELWWGIQGPLVSNPPRHSHRLHPQDMAMHQGTTQRVHRWRKMQVDGRSPVWLARRPPCQSPAPWMVTKRPRTDYLNPLELTQAWRSFGWG
jgi:hypothetical protein